MKCRLCNQEATTILALKNGAEPLEIHICEKHLNFFKHFSRISEQGFSVDEFIQFLDSLETFYLGNLELKEELVDAGAEGEFDEYSRVLLVVGLLIDNMVEDPNLLVTAMNLYFSKPSKWMC